MVGRFFYVDHLRSQNFLCKSELNNLGCSLLTKDGDTLDIAIWSTVELGLAITAGSLATLRPLFTSVLYKLGLLTQPSNLRLYPYGNPSTSLVLGGYRNPKGNNEMNMYKLFYGFKTGTIEDNSSDLTVPKSTSTLPKSPNWYATHFERIRRASMGMPAKKEADNESERSLSVKAENVLDASLADEGGLQIVIERSFFVTDAERLSYIDRERQR